MAMRNVRDSVPFALDVTVYQALFTRTPSRRMRSAAVVTVERSTLSGLTGTFCPLFDALTQAELAGQLWVHLSPGDLAGHLLDEFKSIGARFQHVRFAEDPQETEQ